MYDECIRQSWEEIRHTKEAIRARAILLVYTLVISTPFVCLAAVAAVLCGLRPHEVTGISCYNTMITSLFFFDTLRTAAHACFAEARDQGLVTFRKGIPTVNPAYPHHRLARLSFAVGANPDQSKD